MGSKKAPTEGTATKTTPSVKKSVKKKPKKKEDTLDMKLSQFIFTKF